MLADLIFLLANAYQYQKELLILSSPCFAKVTAAGMLLAALTGCANHLPVETVNSMDIDREALRQNRIIQPQDINQSFIDQPAPLFNASVQESFQVTTYSVNKTLEVYTPQGNRMNVFRANNAQDALTL